MLYLCRAVGPALILTETWVWLSSAKVLFHISLLYGSIERSIPTHLSLKQCKAVLYSLVHFLNNIEVSHHCSLQFTMLLCSIVAIIIVLHIYVHMITRSIHRSIRTNQSDGSSIVTQ